MGDDRRPVSVKALDIDGRCSAPYPGEFAQGFEKRNKRAIGDVFGLDQFGVNLVTLEPGAISSLRHWHQREDEFIYLLEGELVLVTNNGETELTPGMAAGFPAGEANGHQLVNRSGEPAHYIEVGTRSSNDEVDYPDIDMKAEKRGGAWRFLHKDGTPYEETD